jgi:hypothetical protein
MKRRSGDAAVLPGGPYAQQLSWLELDRRQKPAPEDSVVGSNRPASERLRCLAGVEELDEALGRSVFVQQCRKVATLNLYGHFVQHDVRELLRG